MKVQNKKIVTLFIFAVFILLQGISLATSAVDKLDEEKIADIIVEDTEYLSYEEKETLDLINEYRRENGLSDLKPIAKLQNIAKLKAEDLIDNEYFAHNSNVLGTPFEMLKKNGVNYKFAGENLARGTTVRKNS